MSFFHGSELPQWVIKTDTRKLFETNRETKFLQIKQVFYCKQRGTFIECLVFMVSDGKYTIPALIHPDTARDQFQPNFLSTVNMNTDLSFVHNRVIQITRSMVAACKINDVIYPYLVVLDWEYQKEFPYTTLDPNVQDIFHNQQVQKWIHTLNMALPSEPASISSYFVSKQLHRKFKNIENIEEMLGRILGDYIIFDLVDMRTPLIAAAATASTNKVHIRHFSDDEDIQATSKSATERHVRSVDIGTSITDFQSRKRATEDVDTSNALKKFKINAPPQSQPYSSHHHDIRDNRNNPQHSTPVQYRELVITDFYKEGQVSIFESALNPLVASTTAAATTNLPHQTIAIKGERGVIMMDMPEITITNPASPVTPIQHHHQAPASTTAREVQIIINRIHSNESTKFCKRNLHTKLKTLLFTDDYQNYQII